MTSCFKTEEEAEVTQEVMRECERMVEQQLVVKGNEIRRVSRAIAVHAYRGSQTRSYPL